jgi:pilus assembly protein CpaB
MVSTVLKFALILLAAAVLAIVARFVFVARATGSRQAAVVPTVQMRVASVKLPAGLLLRDNDLASQATARNQLPKGALLDSDDNKLRGALLRRDLEAGTPITDDAIMHTDAPGFLAAALRPGMRAVSVPVDDVSGNAGLIQPGDYVDMILTQNIQRTGEGRNMKSVVSETVVQKVRVIAVGSSFTPPREDKITAPARARTVTVEVNPRTAESVTVAAQLGTLSLALRSFAIDNPQDAASGTELARGDSDPVWGGDISRALRDTRPGLEPPTPPSNSSISRRTISVFRGQEKQELDFPPGAP